MLLEEHAEEHQIARKLSFQRLRMKKTKKREKLMQSSYDVNGSYTGTPQDGGKPVQDADDL